MTDQFLQPGEKKVEYVELIYDLIFVYIIGRNNSLLHNFENGFVAPAFFLAYVMTTLAAIQIWNYTTYYINVHGKNGARDNIFLFINMFLLYFIGEATRADWQAYHTQYHLAWALILVNICAQYLLELTNHREEPESRQQILRMSAILLGEAAVVLASIPVFRILHASNLSLAAVLFGMAAVVAFGQRKSGSFVDFPHLSERAMLYVVFSFGEMIIAIASYFEGSFSVRNTYFALMAFLIVVGLFISYGYFYDHIIDRERQTNGLGYMCLHIFIIFTMNNITNSLEFMREEEVSLMPKILFLVGSLVLFFSFLFILGGFYAKARCGGYESLCLKAAAAGAGFIILMVLLRNDMVMNIALTVIFVFGMFAVIYGYGAKIESGRCEWVPRKKK